MSFTNKSLQSCMGCKSQLQKEYIGCSACKSKYDLLCANIPNERFKLMDREHKRTWKCPACLVTANRQPKTDDTPIRSAALGTRDESDASGNITQRRKQPISPSMPSILQNSANSETIPELTTASEIDSFWSELRAARIEMNLFRTTLVELTDTIKQNNIRIDLLESRIESIELKINEGVSQSGLHSMEATIAQLQQDLRDRDQDMLTNDIEISGIPETFGEGITHIVLAVAAKIGVELEERDIVTAERVGPPRPLVEGGPAPRPRPLAVRLTRRAHRDAMLREARVRRGATTADMGITGNPRPFYVNERLTKHNRQLFQRAREFAGRAKWRYVWTRDGKVYTRKESGKERHRLRLEADIEKVFGLAPVCSIPNA